MIVVSFGPKAQPFTQPWATPSGSGVKRSVVTVQRVNCLSQGTVGPLGRYENSRYPVPLGDVQG
jgi:hypothetical protein